jgi:PAS domain S-box-containing protein
MSLLMVSVLIRLAAIGWAMAWSIVLMRRLQKWWVGFITVLLSLMALREGITLFGPRDPGIIALVSGAAEKPGIILSIALFIAVPVLVNMITARTQAEESLRESEAKFRALAETAAAAIYIHQDSKFVYVNPATEAHTGYDREDLLRMCFWEAVHPESRDLVRERGLARQRGEGVQARYEFKIITKGGETRWLDAAAASLDYKGKPAVIGAAFDITERKRAESALREMQERLSHLLLYSPAIVYSLQVEGEGFTVEWVSESLTRLTGYTTTEALREGWWRDHLHPDDLAPVMAALPRLFAEDRLVEEYRFRPKEGGYLWLHDEMVLLRDTSGTPVEVIGSWVDVTERREAEAALRESEERFRTLVGSMDDIVFTLDRERRYTGVYGSWIERFGLKREGFIGKTASEIVGPEAGQMHEETFARALAGERVIYEWSPPNAPRELYFQSCLSPIRNQDGEVASVVGVGRDVTQRRQTEEMLRRRTAQLAALHEIELEISAENGLRRVLDVVTRRAAELLNASYCCIYIHAREQAELNLVAALDGELIGLHLREGEGLAGQAVLTGETQVVADYGEWEGRASLFEGKEFGPALAVPLKRQQTAIGAVCLSRKRAQQPFTEDDSSFFGQIAAEAAIAIHQATLFEEVKESRQRLQVLSHRLIDAQEAERKRLARELHDQIGQALTAVQIGLQTLRPSLERISDARRLEEGLAGIEDALRRVHDLSLDLRPSLLDDLGLEAALRWYVDRVAGSAGLAGCFNADLIETRLVPEIETACFRIAQEAITNVLRHSNARAIWVRLEQCDHALQLAIRDDGSGFKVSDALSRTGPNASLGLQGMRERAIAVGGVVEIESAPGEGTEVRASFPFGSQSDLWAHARKRQPPDINPRRL